MTIVVIIHGYIIPEWELIKNAILYEYNGDDMWLYNYTYTSRYIHMHSGKIMGLLSIVVGCNIISWEYWTADINLMRM